MPELEVVRRHYPEVPPGPAIDAVRQDAWDELRARIDAPPRPRTRGRLRLAIAVGAVTAAAAAAAAVLVGPPGGGGTASAAARALREAASAARSQPVLAVPRDGRYLYVRTVEAHLTQTDIGPRWLEPQITESWLGPEGGRTRVSYGEFEFLSPGERRRFREAFVDRGLPVPAPPAKPRLFDAPPPDRLRLPSDADALYGRLYARARGHSEGTYREMFTLVGDALRDPTATTPRQRAALYEVAARIPGVELAGRVRDRAGRRGIAVTMRNEPDGTRDSLIFDPGTGALLGQERVALPDGFYPAGKTVSYATYSSGIVDSIGSRP
jgi:hypothetical protein